MKGEVRNNHEGARSNLRLSIQCRNNYIIYSLCSRHIHKDIKLQKGMKGIDQILCKTDLNLILRLTYRATQSTMYLFKAFLKSACAPLWYSQF